MADDGIQGLRRLLRGGGTLDVTINGELVERVILDEGPAAPAVQPTDRSRGRPGPRHALPGRERIARNVALLEGLGHTEEDSEHLRNLKAALAKMDAESVCEHPSERVVALYSADVGFEWCASCGALRRAPGDQWMLPERVR